VCVCVRERERERERERVRVCVILSVCVLMGIEVWCLRLCVDVCEVGGEREKER